MGVSNSILLLAGSAEARQVASALTECGVDVRALMSEPPRGNNPMPVPFDVCAPVTQRDLAKAMSGARAVIDASHGFDAAMTQAGYDAACAVGLPFISLVRTPWDSAGQPGWATAPDVAAAMSLINPGARVFSATGWASLADCAAFPGGRLMLRQTTEHMRPVPYDFVELVFGAPPFDAAKEMSLFKELNVDTLMLRNLGGKPSRPKLDAASALGLNVILIDRPKMPDGVAVVNSVDAVLNWLAQQ